eukprot:TRINITY_DN791_c0_g1_i3.p1 TRINITY_DN791_c0_g1~~TRINITY_DN791_c0_g1_i3.p1  ORF type:complete len:292 (-),score=88.40 TRINITY_DN791_c0_g1_i3:162-1037(-)
MISYVQNPFPFPSPNHTNKQKSMSCTIKEYRVLLPLTVDEYHIGQLYAVAKASAEETDGDEGVEVLVNEPYDDENGKGQFTHKIYHLGSRVPGWVSAIAPADALKLEEKAWNGFPHCRTVQNLVYLGNKFEIVVETWHCDDAGTQENVHDLDDDKLKQREVVFIDIADPYEKDYKEEEDPAVFSSEKTGRGPLKEGWVENTTPVMCCYKLVTARFEYWGFQTKVENFIHSFSKDIFTSFHRQLFCWIDEWHGWTIEDIRAYEAKIKEELDQKLGDNAQGESAMEDDKSNSK